MKQTELLITNANIITLDKSGSRAKSLVVSDGRIKSIWETAEPPESEIHRTEHMKELDLKGATLIPGFIDTHNHLIGYAMNKTRVDCRSVSNASIGDIQQRIQRQCELHPAGEWIVGYGYDDTSLSENRHPTKVDLDAVSTEHPILIRHVSGHIAVANSKALDIAGIDDQTEQPHGGHIEKNRAGELTGVLYEIDAMNLVIQKIPLQDTDSIISLVKAATLDYLAEGITTNTEAGVGLSFGSSELDIHLRAINEKANPMKMRLMIAQDLLIDDGEFSGYTAEQLDEKICKDSSGRAKLDSAKLFQDGSIQGLTGALRNPYYCDENLYGELIYEQSDLNKRVLDFHKRGFRVAIHGNGDRSIGSIIEAYEYAIQHGGARDHRHRIEHVQTATTEDLEKMKELGIAASFFINHVYYWGDRHRDIFIGPVRASRINPLKEAQTLDLLYTLHSDCPITPISPLFSIWAAVNRVTKDGEVLGVDQKIDVETALKAMTIYGAWMNFEEQDMGSIEIGKTADFAILSEDPTTTDPMNIKDIEVLQTIIDGEIVYKKQKVRSAV